jgi:hypothetical protein
VNKYPARGQRIGGECACWQCPRPEITLVKFFPPRGTSVSTYANDLIFGASSQEFAVGAEADASDVEIPILVGR